MTTNYGERPGMFRPIDQCENNALALMDNKRFRNDCAALIVNPVNRTDAAFRNVASGWGILPDTLARCLEVLYGVRS